VLVVSAVIMVPLILLAGAASAGLAPGDLSVLEDPDIDPEDFFAVFSGAMGAILAPSLIGSLVQQIGTVLVQAGTTKVYGRSYQGEKMGPGEALRDGLRKYVPMLGLWLITGVASFLPIAFAVMVGLVIGGVPGLLVGFALFMLVGIPGVVWLSTVWGVAPAALITEDIGIFAALARSYRLVKGNFWRTLGLIFVAQILVGIIVGVVIAPLQFGLSFGMGLNDPDAVFGPAYLAASTILSGIATAFTIPFVAAVVVAIYFDLRVRKEGFDLEQMIAELGGPAIPVQTDTDQSDPFGLG
jgi:hypothetical protein